MASTVLGLVDPRLISDPVPAERGEGACCKEARTGELRREARTGGGLNGLDVRARWRRQIICACIDTKGAVELAESYLPLEALVTYRRGEDGRHCRLPAQTFERSCR